jgi:hypothetical protein
VRARNAIGTAGVELAGRAEKATAATHEALEPGAYGEAASAQPQSATSRRGWGVKLRRQRAGARCAATRRLAQTRGAAVIGRKGSRRPLQGSTNEGKCGVRAGAN